MRLFIGIPLSPEKVNAIERLCQGLRSADDGFRWSSPQSWHITVQFLGETTELKYACLVGNLKRVHSPSFPVQIAGTGFFDRAGIFFAGVSESPQLASLHRQVVAATARCGFAADSRPFHPHITLARAKGKDSRKAIRLLKTKIHDHKRLPSSLAREFILYQVFLSSGGSRYEVCERFPLAGD